GGQLRAGDTLDDGRYLLIKPVGRGGFAIVWEAYDRSNQVTVAVKVLHSHLAGDPLRRARFFRGARAMMKLAGSATVRVLEPEAQDGGFHYFVMEYLSGGNLSDAVLQKRVIPERAIPLMLEVCEAMASAHAMGFIHRDIKPSNILLDDAGGPRLADFDLVAAHDTTGGTRTGALGSLLYAAPECLDRPQDATASADVYGLGMTAIFCLTGQELTRSVFRSPERSIAALNCTSQLKAVLRRAVAWEPEERFLHAGYLLRALQDASDISSRTSDEPSGGIPIDIAEPVASPLPADLRLGPSRRPLIIVAEPVPSNLRLGPSRRPLIVVGLSLGLVGGVGYKLLTRPDESSLPPIDVSLRTEPDAALPDAAEPDADTGLTRDDIVALSRFGFFSITANGKTQIYIDNNKIGETPLTRLPVLPGAHAVKAIGPRGKIKMLKVTIYGGQDTDEGTITW
ncbi:MAG TPA: serine/threonine-protein kinase, partial [Vicinamibacterales bacterium]